MGKFIALVGFCLILLAVWTAVALYLISKDEDNYK